MTPPDWTLYLVTDRAMAGDRGVAAVVEAAVAGGVSIVQLREKSLGDEDVAAAARDLKTRLDPRGVPLVIDDRIEVARAVGAAGVHLGQRDRACAEARRILGPDAIVGISVSTADEAIAAERAGATYLGISPVFDTPTKTDTPAATGLSGLRRIRAVTSLPLVAIGGLHAGNAAEVVRCGADGVAVVSAIMAADDPRAAARALRAAVEAGRRRPVALSIAGSDSGGGAGVQADLAVFRARGVWGASAITCVTAQSPRGLRRVDPLEPAAVRAQIDAVFESFPVAAVKVGMLFSPAIVTAVAETLEAHWRDQGVPVVVDPVMRSTSGATLLVADAERALIERVLPLATVITPNLAEAAALAECERISDEDGMGAAAERIAARVGAAVLVKGGHLPSSALDVLRLPSGERHRLEGHRVAVGETHGTGCTLSAAIAADLAKGRELVSACRAAKAFVARSLEARWDLGRGLYGLGWPGHGPTHHHGAPWRFESVAGSQR